MESLDQIPVQVMNKAQENIPIKTPSVLSSSLKCWPFIYHILIKAFARFQITITPIRQNAL